LWGSGPNDVYVGNANELSHWNGSGWEPPPGTNPPSSALLIWGSAPDNVWVYSAAGISQFDGTTWTQHTLMAGVYPQAVASSGPTDSWVIVAPYYAPSVAHHWDGTQWTQLPIPVDATQAAAAPSSHLLWLVSWTGDIIRYVH
jgi:hypothetical protein